MRHLLALTWFLLAAWFLFASNSGGRDVELDGPRPDARELVRGPARAGMTEPRVRIGGFEQKCSDCHALFSSLEVTPSEIRQHEHIALDHGLNDRCYNCHSREDRNSLVLHDGELVSFQQSSTLCSNCHGTVYRDWERGMHGKTMGSWVVGSEDQVRLRCADCHDPHAPAFPDFDLLPGPRHPHGPEAVKERHVTREQLRNPLERWKQTLQRPAHRADPSPHHDPEKNE